MTNFAVVFKSIILFFILHWSADVSVFSFTAIDFFKVYWRRLGFLRWGGANTVKIRANVWGKSANLLSENSSSEVFMNLKQKYKVKEFTDRILRKIALGF